MLNKLRQKARQQEGAYTLEFLVMLTFVLTIIMIIVQVTLSLLQGVMFNHALSLAAQQASERGGIDRSVQYTFQSHLPSGMRINDGADQGISAYKISSAGATNSFAIAEEGGNGREATVFGEIFCIQGKYKPLASGLIGVTGESAITRTMTVSSHSSQEGKSDTTPNKACS